MSPLPRRLTGLPARDGISHPARRCARRLALAAASLAACAATALAPASAQAEGARTLYAYANGAGAPKGCPAQGEAKQGCSLAQALDQIATNPSGSTLLLATAGVQGDPATYYSGNFTALGGKLTIEPALAGHTAILDGNKGSSHGCRSGGCNGPVLSIAPNLDEVVLTGLTIQHGANSTGSGGGLRLSGGDQVEVSHVTFAADSSAGSGGAIDASDGGTPDALAVTESTFEGDSAAVRGGAINDASGSVGTSALTVTGSAFANDVAPAGGAISNADGASGTLAVTGSTFSRDAASTGAGGAIDSGEEAGAGELAVSESTFFENTDTAAGGGGAIALAQDGTGTVLASVAGSTFATEPGSATPGWALANGSAPGSSTTVVADIFARTSACEQGASMWTDDGYNAAGDGACLSNPAAGGDSDTQGNALAGELAALHGNGGATETMALLAGNPAIGLLAYPESAEKRVHLTQADGVEFSPCPTTDQRGDATTLESACDAGAVQLAPLSVAVSGIQGPGPGGAGTVKTVLTYTTTPARAYLQGIVTCTRLQGGEALEAARAPGAYTIEPSSCSGLSATENTHGYLYSGIQYTAASGSLTEQGSTPELCVAGDYHAEGTCHAATSGDYVSPEAAAAGATSAAACPSGSYVGYTGQSACFSTTAGSFSTKLGVQGPQARALCSSGRYAPLAASTACLNAPVGTYAKSAGASEPSACAAGSSQSSAGSLSCSPVTRGNYAATTRAVAGQHCAAGKTTASPGATSESSCYPEGSTLPGAPGNVSATPGSGQATVSFEAPSESGGSPITRYVVEATDQTHGEDAMDIAAGSASPITISGLVGGDSYTFKARAISAVGTGPASTQSGPVTVGSTAIVPVITQIIPESGPTGGGTTIEILGENLGTPSTADTVTVGGANAAINQVSETRIAAVVPAGEGVSVPVIVTREGVSSAPATFSYDPPTLGAISPGGPRASGSAVTIFGSNFSPNAVAYFGSSAAQTLKASHSMLEVVVPAGSAEVQLHVVVDGQVSNALTFHYAEPAARVEAEQEIGGGAFTTAAIEGSAGEPIDYEIVVTDTGNTQLALNSLTEEGCSGLAGGAGELQPGGHTTWTCSKVLAGEGGAKTEDSASLMATPPAGEGSAINASSNVLAATVRSEPAFTIEALQSIRGGAYTNAPLAGSDGEVVSVQTTVTDTGNTELALSDFTQQGCAPASGGAAELAPGGATKWTCSLTLSGYGEHPIGASVTASEGLGTKQANTLTVDIAEEPSLSLKSSSTSTSYSAMGETIPYSFMLENSGNVALEAIELDAPEVAGVSCPEASLGAGAHETCTGSRTVTQGDIWASSITITATASGIVHGASSRTSSAPSPLTLHFKAPPSTCSTAKGNGTVGKSRQPGALVLVEALSTNLAAKQKLTFKYEGALVHAKLLKLEAARCSGAAGSRVFEGSGTAQKGREKGYTLKFAITESGGGFYFRAKLIKGAAEAEYAGGPLKTRNEKIS